MLKKINDEDVGLIRRIAQIGIWRIVREYQQCLQEIERYAKTYVKEYLSECNYCSWYYESGTTITIAYMRGEKEYYNVVELDALVREGLKSTYLC